MTRTLTDDTLARSVSLSESSQNAASMPVSVIAVSSCSLNPSRSAQTRYSPPIVASKYGRIVGAERQPDARVAQRRQRVLVKSAEHAEHDVAGRARVEHDPPGSDLIDQRWFLDRTDTVVDPCHRQRQRRAHALGPRPLARVDGAPDPSVGGDRERLGELVRWISRLVAGHREADRVRMWPAGGVSRHCQRALYPEVADRRDQNPSLDPVRVARVIDAAGDALQMLLLAEPHQLGMIGRRGQLDVDRPLLRTPAEVLVGDVAVVLSGADHACREVVDAQEVQEVTVVKAAVLVEQPLGQLEPVAPREPLHQLRGRGALQMGVQLDLRKRLQAHRSTSTTTRPPPLVSAASETTYALRNASAARSALDSSRA